MIQPIMKDPIFLAQKSVFATPEDLTVAENLFDTLTSNKDSCVGMAANMIDVSKRIIIFENDGTYMVMFNPKIIRKTGPYEAPRKVACPYMARGRPDAGSILR